MSSDAPESAASAYTKGGCSASQAAGSDKGKLKEKEKARVNRTSLILWHAHQNDAVAVRKLLEEDRSLVHAMDYDKRTPLHVASLHGWIDVAKCLIEFDADINAQDRWKNTVLLSFFGYNSVNLIRISIKFGCFGFLCLAIVEAEAELAWLLVLC